MLFYQHYTSLVLLKFFTQIYAYGHGDGQSLAVFSLCYLGTVWYLLEAKKNMCSKMINKFRY